MNVFKRKDKPHRSEEEERPTKAPGIGSDMPLLQPDIGTGLARLFGETQPSKQKELLKYQLHIGADNVKGTECIDGLSEGTVAQRLCLQVGPPLFGVIVDLKIHGQNDITRGLEKIASTKDSDIGQKVKDTLKKVAEGILEGRKKGDGEGEKITNPDQLYKLFVDKITGSMATNYVLGAFCDFRHSITWQTDDGLPTVNPTDINHKDDIADTLTKHIFYRVQTVLSPMYWSDKAEEYRSNMMDAMDNAYMNKSKSDHAPRLPIWFESKTKKAAEYLEGKFQECQKVLEKEKKKENKKNHDTDKCSKARCRSCVRPSNSQNVVYFWLVDLGKHLSTAHAIRCRSYAGIATGGHLCKQRWGQHFKDAKDLIDLLVSSTSPPEVAPSIQLVDVVLALAIVEDLESALYCLGVFGEPKAASAYESEVIAKFGLQEINKGLNNAS